MDENGKKIGNLIPFQKGKTGNPKGRPKGARSFKTILRELLLVETKEIDPISGEERKISQKEKLAIAAVLRAMKDEAYANGALEQILNRLEGKVTEKVEQTVTAGPSIDLSKLSTEELEQWRALLEKAGKSTEGDTE